MARASGSSCCFVGGRDDRRDRIAPRLAAIATGTARHVQMTGQIRFVNGLESRLEVKSLSQQDHRLAAGWGGRDRTSEWRNQNPLGSRRKSAAILNFERFASPVGSIGYKAIQNEKGARRTSQACRLDAMASELVAYPCFLSKEDIAPDCRRAHSGVRWQCRTILTLPGGCPRSIITHRSQSQACSDRSRFR